MAAATAAAATVAAAGGGDAAGTSSSVARMPSSSSTAPAVELSDFDLLGEAGTGGYGRVYRVRRRSRSVVNGGTVVVQDAGVEYALKVLKKKAIKKSNEVSHVKSEADILKAVNHPFVVSLSYTFQTRSLLCFVMEFASGGDLHSRLVRISSMNESQAKFYVCEVILGLEYLHSEVGVVFRDLKPENVLIEGSGHVKLCDFGLSRFMDSDGGRSSIRWRATKTYCGTVEYMAPEVIGREGHSFPVDWWAVGVLFYDLTCGAPPFFVDDLMDESGEKVVLCGKEQTKVRIVQEELSFPKRAGLSRGAKELIIALLKKDFRKRLGTTTRVREHKYFEGVDWERVLMKEVRPPYVPSCSDSSSSSVGEQATEDAVTWVRRRNQNSSVSSSDSRSSSSSNSSRRRRMSSDAAIAEAESVFMNFDWVCPELTPPPVAGGEAAAVDLVSSSSSPPPLVRSEDGNSVEEEAGSSPGSGDVYLRSVEEEQQEMRRILRMMQNSVEQRHQQQQQQQQEPDAERHWNSPAGHNHDNNTIAAAADKYNVRVSVTAYNAAGAAGNGDYNGENIVVGAIGGGGWGLWGDSCYSGVSILRDSRRNRHGAIGSGGGGAFNDDTTNVEEQKTEQLVESGGSSYKLFGEGYPLKNLLGSSRL